jgi:hypothetical protein
MSSIAEIGIANSIIELARRCGLKPSQVDGNIEFHLFDSEPSRRSFYQVEFFSNSSEEPEKTEKFFKLLGMENTWTLTGPDLEDIEEKLEKALALAPRERTR